MNVSLKSRTRAQHWTKGCLGLLATLLVSAGAVAASGQAAGAPVTPNFKDVDFAVLTQAVSVATGKNFIIYPHVEAKVTMISATPMPPAAFYEAFLSIVSVHGWIAKDDGNVVRIFPAPHQ
jgi:general secretion pathway protein D